MKKIVTRILLGLIFLIGLLVMLYPSISNWVNERNQSRVVAGYSEAVEKLTETDYSAYLQAAIEHNNKIAQAGSLSSAVLMEKEDNFEEYNSLLNVADNSVMGVIKIPKIKIEFPIYHTTSDAVLQVGIGHFTGSSLPVGGKSTHCILSGHRGLPSAKLFTDLDQITEGDKIYIKVLGDTLAYQVDQIQVVLPNEVEQLDVIPGEDYVTLVTCTPYGINSHRLLVRGTRVPYVEGEEEEKTDALAAKADTSAVNPAQNDRKLPIIPIFAVVVFTLAIVVGTICGNRSNKKAKKKSMEKE